MRVPARLLFLALSIRLCAGEPSAAPAARLPSPEAKGSYVVLISAGSDREAGWAEVADTLVAKYDAARVVVRDGEWETALPTLRRLHPRYVCLVARPEEAGRDTVVRMHRMLRKLDMDPYQDAIWSILTGYEAADAQRIAAHGEPLRISSGFSSMGIGLAERLGGGFGSMEVKPTEFHRLTAEGKDEVVSVTPDSAKVLAESFNTTPVDLMWTSGHATERDWQIAFNLPGGEVRSENGQLFTRNSWGERFDFSTPNPKVYLPMGNCLIGHVDGPEALALAWMHTGGVYQMPGYTVVTFYGYMGWGVNTYFDGHGLTLSESVNANRQAVLHKLLTDFPHAAGIDFERFDIPDIQRNARRFGLQNRDLVGLLWDRDTLAFYGDPAWEARMPTKDRGWTVTQVTKAVDGTGRLACSLRVETTRDGNWGERPLVFFFRERLDDIQDVRVTGLDKAMVLDDLALLPVSGDFAAGSVIELVWTAVPAARADTKDQRLRLDTLPENVQKDLGGWRLQRKEILRVLHAAGERAEAWWDTAKSMDQEGYVHFVLLMMSMTDEEARSLPMEELKRHVLAQQNVWRNAPWAKWVGGPGMREGLMAYRNLDESWDGWALKLREIALPLVEGATTSSEAALRLNQELFPRLGVSYHATKRPKANQNATESIEAGYASCTGLSILLANACRSVGVPARVVGIPRWPEGEGNHTWVEIWDRGIWFPMGAAEPAGLGEAWFLQAASKAVASRPEHRIYASSLLRGSEKFLLPWDPMNREVRAMDATHAYVNGAVGKASDLPMAEPLWTGDLVGVKAALAAGANPNVVMDDLRNPPQSALVWALSRGYPEVAQALREAGGKIWPADFPVARDLVRDALLAGKPDAARVLLENGFNPRWVDADGNTLLHACLERRGKDEGISILLGQEIPLDGLNKAGETALELAVRYGRDQAVGLLLSAGADPWAGHGGETLYAALRRGLPEVVSKMLSADRPRVTPEEATRLLPICFYFSGIQPAAALKLLDWGADPMARKADGVLAGAPSLPTLDRYAKGAKGPALYDVARRAAHADLVAAFEAKAPEINRLNTNGVTALFVAAAAGDLTELERLLEAGAWVERASSADGRTPLLAAAAAGHLEVVERLLKEGAGFDMRGKDGKGAMELAIDRKDLPLVQLFCASGVDPAAKSGARPSPMEYARMQGAGEILRMFESLADKESQFVWTDDVEAALVQAKENGIPVGLFFTGSDWCGACKTLKKEVLDIAAFRQRFGGRFVPVELDYPRRAKQDEALKARNQAMLEKYFPDGRRGYPTWILLTPEGEESTRIVGYRLGSSMEWMDQFEQGLKDAREKKQ